MAIGRCSQLLLLCKAALVQPSILFGSKSSIFVLNAISEYSIRFTFIEDFVPVLTNCAISSIILKINTFVQFDELYRRFILEIDA